VEDTVADVVQWLLSPRERALDRGLVLVQWFSSLVRRAVALVSSPGCVGYREEYMHPHTHTHMH